MVLTQDIIFDLHVERARETLRSNAIKPSKSEIISNRLLERLDHGPVICAEGYLFELERRGYVSAGAFVPEVVLEHPDAVAQLHREFLRAGSDVIEAFTYYAHREKLRAIGQEATIEALNRAALRIAKDVAAEGDALVAGNICNTNIFEANSPSASKSCIAMFEEQVEWAVDEGVDFIIGETFSYFEEARLALDVIRKAGMPAVITVGIHRELSTPDGYSPADCCKRLEDAGADVVGLNCMRGPATMLPLLSDVCKAVSVPVAALPVPYRTSEDQPTFISLKDLSCTCIPDDRPFPTALEPLTCNRYEIAEFTRAALELGVRYLGLCCGGAPHMIRAMAEAMGRQPPASKYSPDMSKHAYFGKNQSEHNRTMSKIL